MSAYANKSQIYNDKKRYFPYLNINFNQNNNKEIKTDTFIYNKNIGIKGSNNFPINNKGEHGLANKHNNKITNLNYLNRKTQSFIQKNNIEINEYSNPSVSLINENKKKY